MRSNLFAARARRVTKSFHTSPFTAFLLTLLTLVAPVAGLAQTQKNQQQCKPVARLVSTSRQTAPPRARLIASVPASQLPPTGRISSPPVRVSSSRPVSNSTSAASFAGASSLERRAFELVNAERRARGESPLVWDAELSRLARQHSSDMARTGALNHTGPDGRGMADRARAAGIRGWQVLGENIAYNQGYDDPSGFAVQRWMGSAMHRANILNGQFTRTGIGVARAADGSIYFTQVFMS